MATLGSRDQYLTEVILALRDQLTAESQRANASMDKLDRNADELSVSFDKAGRSSDRFGTSLKSLGIQALALNEIRHLIFALLSPLQKVGEASDVWQEMTGRVKIFTKEGESASAIMAEIARIAQESRTPIKDIGNLYARLAQGLSEQNVSQKDLLGVVQGLSDALLISGATAAESGGAIMQFSQAMASGVLRGEEFNSVAEQAPLILDALARELGVAKGELRAMAAEGKLTSDVLRSAILNSAKGWREAAETIPLTIGRAMENLNSAMTEFVGTSESASAGAMLFANAIQGLADNLDTVSNISADAAVIAMTAAAIGGVAALKEYSSTLAANSAQAKANLAAGKEAAAAKAAQAEASLAAARAAAIEAHEAQKLSVERQAEAANMAKTTAAKRLAMEASVLNAKADIEAAKAAAGIAAANLEEVKAKAALMRASGQTFSFRKMLTAATQQAALAANALTAAEQRLAAVTLEAGTTQRIATLDAQALTLATQGAAVAATEAAIANKAVSASALEAAAAQKAAAAANTAVALTMKELFSFNTLLNGAMATFIGYEVGSYIREWAKETKAGAIAFEAFDQWLRYLSDDYDQLIRVERDHAKTLKAQAEQLRAVEVHTGLVYKSQKELMEAVEDGLVLWNSQTKQWERGVDAAKKLAQGLGTIDTAYARSIEILDEYAKVQKDAGDLRVNQAKYAADMAKALGDERTGLIAANEAKQVALDVARETVTMEAALLARTQERLDQLTRETAFTKGAANAKADQIKVLTEEIQKRQLAYEKAKLQAGQAEIEVEQARATAESYGDQADQLDTLIQRREALTMSLQAYEQVAAEGNVTLAEYEALQNKSIEAANRLGDAYNRQAYDEIPALLVEVQALQKRVMDLRETMDLGRIADEKAVNVRKQLANVTARLKDSSKDALDRIERESAALERSTDLRSASLKLMKQDLDVRADAAESLEKEVEAMELRNMQGQVEVEQLRVSADAKRKEADLLAQKATALAKVGAATGEYTDAEQAQAQASFDAAAAARIEADGITNLANAKAKLAEQNIRLAESGTIQLRQAAEAANREAEASARYADIEDKRLQVLKDQTEARKAHAIIVGDDVAAQKAAVDVAKLEVTIAERAAAGKREQARLLAEEANLREVSYLASQKSNRETEASIVALRDAAEMASLEADALDVTVQVKKEAVTQTEKLNAAEIKLFSSMDLVLKQIELYASAQEKAFAAKNEMVGVSLALAEAEGKEAEALALKVTKKENDLNLAEQSLKYEETALTLMERKLAILQSTAVTTDAERKKRDQDMALLSGEIALKRQEVEAAGARIEMTKTEMMLAKEAAAQYGDQSGALTKLVNQHSKLSSELARLTEARKAGALASQEIEAAETALAAIEVKLNEEIPKTAEEQRALNHEYESAKLTVDLLTQAIYDGILADQSAVPIKEKLGEITRALADAAKDAIANIDAEIAANERALSLSQARLTLDSDWNALMATRAKVRGDDVRAQELAIEVMKNEAEATRLASEAKERDSMLLAQKAKTMEIAARANGEYTLSEQRQVKQAEAVAEMAGIEAERMAVLAQTKKEVAEQTEALVAREERLRAAFTDAGVAGVNTFADIRGAISAAATGPELQALADGLEKAIQAGVDKAGELSKALAEVREKMENMDSGVRRGSSRSREEDFQRYGTDLDAYRRDNSALLNIDQAVEGYREWLQEQGFFGGSKKPKTAREVAAAQAAEAESRAAPAQQGYRRVVDINLRGAGETATVTASSEDEAERVIRVLRAAKLGAA